jgi:hypothetical protein
MVEQIQVFNHHMSRILANGKGLRRVNGRVYRGLCNVTCRQTDVTCVDIIGNDGMYMRIPVAVAELNAFEADKYLKD